MGRCTSLGATAGQLADFRRRALAAGHVTALGMPGSGQTSLVYAEYLTWSARTPVERPVLRAVSALGPRSTLEKLTTGLGLLF